MSKYKSKQQLLDEISKEKTTLEETISKISKENLSKKGACGEWSVKDIVCHLGEWHSMVLEWYEEGKKGNTPKVPGRGYKWSELPKLNDEIYKQYKQYT